MVQCELGLIIERFEDADSVAVLEKRVMLPFYPRENDVFYIAAHTGIEACVDDSVFHLSENTCHVTFLTHYIEEDELFSLYVDDLLADGWVLTESQGACPSPAGESTAK